MYTPQQHDAVEMERRLIAKAVRSAVRLHYSMLADRAINDVLAPVLEEHAKALAEGREYTLDISQLGLPDEV